MSYEEKLEQAASIAAIVFSHAIKSALAEDIPERMKEIITEDVANDMGAAMAETLMGFFGEDILPVVIAEAKRYGDVKFLELLSKLELIIKDTYAVDKVLPKTIEVLKGLEVDYARPWWARWLGLPGKIKIGGK